MRNLFTEERLRYAFKEFDTDKSGVLTEENLMQAFKSISGEEITHSVAKKIIMQKDLENKGVLSLADFMAIFDIKT